MMTFYFWEHPEEYEILGQDENGSNILEPKNTATVFGIYSLYRFQVESEDELVVENPKELCNRMVQKFKESKCYNFKTQQDKEIIINYLMSHTQSF
ncbi:MAG: hypothetical protein IJ542_02660 [Clostridia bacterium]|nr:hypothetical protein [Clostridia bacterium]